MNGEYLLRRSGQAVLTVVVVVTISFAMIRMLPGGPGVFACFFGGAGGGGMRADCQEVFEQSAASVPPGELAVLGLFVLGLVVLSAYVWKGY